MSIQPNPVEKAQWNTQEVVAHINYLEEHKSQDESAVNFKEVTFSGAVSAIAPFHSSGQ
jgi:hypothetical protein